MSALGGSPLFVVLRLSSLPIVIGATYFLIWLDRRVSGEHILLGNAGVSPAQIVATVIPVVLGLETAVYLTSTFV